MAELNMTLNVLDIELFKQYAEDMAEQVYNLKRAGTKREVIDAQTRIIEIQEEFENQMKVGEEAWRDNGILNKLH